MARHKAILHKAILNAATTVVALLLAAAVATAQTTPAPTPGVPRTADGKADLSGVWQAVNTAAWDLEDHEARLMESDGVHRRWLLAARVRRASSPAQPGRSRSGGPT